MGAAAETVSLQRDAPSRSPETAGPESAPAMSGASFDPFVDRLLAGAPAEPSDSAAGSLSVQRLKAPVLQRAQRLYGNHASQQMVMRSRVLQRQCACGGTCAKCREQEEQRAVQRQSSAQAPSQFDGIPASQGQPLDVATRRPLEAHFGADLDDVRVHTGPEAAESARSLDALAYTSGRDIYFAPGMYAPASGGGQRLLAHEVAHVVQQSAGQEPSIATKSSSGVKIGAPDDSLEQEAEKPTSS
jgi:bacterioferritin-associated ferredoxin